MWAKNVSEYPCIMNTRGMRTALTITIALTATLALAGCGGTDTKAADSIATVKDRYAECLTKLDATKFEYANGLVTVTTSKGVIDFSVGTSNTGTTLTTPGDSNTTDVLATVGC